MLLPGVTGQFGGPLLQRLPEWPHRPAGEWEATDAYLVEFRLWQAYGPRIHPHTGADVEVTAAVAVFTAMTELSEPMLHMHDSDKLVAAFHPDHGTYTYPAGTSIYDWDHQRWGHWVIPSPAIRTE